MTRGRYVAPRPAQPPVELTEKQQQARAAYMQLSIASAALRVAYDQLAAHERLAEYLPVSTLEHIRIIGENIANIMNDMDLLHGTMVTQGRETLPKLRDKK